METKTKLVNERIDKGAKPLNEGVEKRHLLKPEPKQSKQGGTPPPIKPKK